jgi:hypothetical protein
MAGGTVKSPVVGCGCRVMIRADWIAGAQPLPFKSTRPEMASHSVPAARLPPAVLKLTS